MNEVRRAYTFADEARGDAYQALLDESLRVCARASLVQRRECGFDAHAQALLSRLTPMLRAEREVSEWPGTRLLGGTAVLREYDLSPAMASALAEAANGLYDWRQPSRPEDLVLWRNDGEPWLVTIAHERDGYLWLAPSETPELLARLAAVGCLLKLDTDA